MLRSSFPEERKGEREREREEKRKKRKEGRGGEGRRGKKKRKRGMTENLGCVHEACGEVSLDTFVATKARCRNRIPLDIVETNDFLIGQIRSNGFSAEFFLLEYEYVHALGEEGGCGPRFSLKTTWNYFTNRERENEERISMRGWRFFY